MKCQRDEDEALVWTCLLLAGAVRHKAPPRSTASVAARAPGHRTERRGSTITARSGSALLTAQRGRAGKGASERQGSEGNAVYVHICNSPTRNRNSAEKTRLRKAGRPSVPKRRPRKPRCLKPSQLPGRLPSRPAARARGAATRCPPPLPRGLRPPSGCRGLGSGGGAEGKRGEASARALP